MTCFMTVQNLAVANQYLVFPFSSEFFLTQSHVQACQEIRNM